MTLQQNGGWLTAPNRSAQQMARPLARATCSGRTSDVLHETYGTGTAYTAFACTYILGGIAMLLSFCRFRGVRKLDESDGGGGEKDVSSKL